MTEVLKVDPSVGRFEYFLFQFFVSQISSYFFENVYLRTCLLVSEAERSKKIFVYFLE